MRVKRGVSTLKRHNKVRKAVKGYTKSNRSSIRRGRQAATKALQYSYRDRRNRKRSWRSLWNSRINAAARQQDTTYSQLIAGMKRSKINIDRKILAELAVNEPKAFEAVIKASLKK
ncbi:MAG TPA: 50S ribosomal protein L20 [Candidatus Saccharimonadales bacterium]|nr:50S ribosomal protein L20 [Candidatus Saccharimonadales bacterium]